MSRPFTPVDYASLRFTKRGEPVSTVFDDVYFSADDGLAESQHVFIEGNQLIARFKALDKTAPGVFVIGELGFGTGLNFLVTLHCFRAFAPSNWRLHFISCEKYPLRLDDLKRACALWPTLLQEANALIANYPVCTPGIHRLDFGHVSLSLLLGDAKSSLEKLIATNYPTFKAKLQTFYVDAWFLDGFTPRKNPELWQMPLLQAVATLSKATTTAATFSVCAEVKQALIAAGFELKKTRGFGRKREMLTARFKPSAKCRHAKETLRGFDTPWVHVPKRDIEKKAIIVGAGLAGAHTAYKLATRGYAVTVLEGETIASGASGNRDGILFAKPSAFHSPFADLFLSHYLYAARFYRAHKLLQSEGMLKLAFNHKEARAQALLRPLLLHYPLLGEWLDKGEAAARAGISLTSGGMYFPLSGVLSPAQVCTHLLAHPNITVQTQCSIEAIHFDKHWHCGDYTAPVVVVACGEKSNRFSQCRHLALQATAGEVSLLPGSASSATLRLAVCADGYVTPATNGHHCLGATYRPVAETISTGNQVNLNRLDNISEVFARPAAEDLASRLSIRATTPDHLPIVGALPIADAFRRDYANLRLDANAFIPSLASYYPGLYMISGFGSHGLSYAPLASEYLACLINNEPLPLSPGEQQSVSAARFLIRAIKRGN